MGIVNKLLSDSKLRTAKLARLDNYIWTTYRYFNFKAVRETYIDANGIDALLNFMVADKKLEQ